jgi:secreted trypsin-like serine protease
MRKIFGISMILALILAVLFKAGPAKAITNGQPDGEAHPYVGRFITDVDHDGQPDFYPFCSGTLLSSTVFLTAGHCLRIALENGWTDYWVSFDSVFQPGESPVIKVETAVMHPEYNPLTNNNDVSLMILQTPVTGRGYGQIPAVNLLKQMKEAGTLSNQVFTNVGYGATTESTGVPVPNFDGVRRWSTSPFIALLPNNLVLLENNHATEQGGICLGDSGGPSFLGNTNVIASITSWGDGTCRAISGSQRLDIPSVRSFISSYIGP